MDFVPIPVDTMLGSLLHYVTHAEGKHFQPMAAVYSLLPRVRKDQRLSLAEASLAKIDAYRKRIDE